jgi:formate dehydrogenase maturation protein FdhE
MKLQHYANNPEFIKDMQTLSYEQRRKLFLQQAGRLQQLPEGNAKSQCLAFLFGIEMSINNDTDADVQHKAQADYQKLREFVIKENA